MEGKLGHGGKIEDFVMGWAKRRGEDGGEFFGGFWGA